MTASMIEVRGLRKRYGAVAVLDGVDLSVGAGQVMALLGPNGAGKTTTVEILATLRRPDSGTAHIAGLDVVHDAAAVRERISLTGQDTAVDELLTGRENLRLMGRLAHLGSTAARTRADGLLELFELTDAADRPTKTYSGGMRRRLDLAVGLLTRPQVLMLDEPTTGLDPRSRNDMWAIVRDVVGAGTTVLLTTQYLDEADALADRVAVLDHGHVVAEGTAADLKRRVGQAHVRVELVGGGVERIPTDGSVGDVRRVLAGLEASHAQVEHWELAAPTLDDVFLTLTGGPPPQGDRARTGPDVVTSPDLVKEAS
ncbi:MAG: ATP-binding cassette domain-containing protein [Cellulomonadaceae bacterium]|nr:ATP-binding cassette domain-containing protein [Cellulomonadaceae bacterium]